MGVNIAKAALAAGNTVVATGRNIDAVSKAVGQAEDLLVVKLDITSPADAQAAVQAAVDRFGRIDVLVNNAANFYGGYFEELTPEQIERQLTTGLIGQMNVTRAVLPVMRKQRSGQIISISSGAGLSGFEFNSAYAAAKFGLEGWMESLAPEVAPRLGRLAWAKGSVPTPHGMISVEASVDRVTVDSPVPVVVDLVGQPARDLPSGRHEIAVQ
jgi:NAD(P)-dependent dehydrogenase (short-subunit alcohol dehydrogenase family)